MNDSRRLLSLLLVMTATVAVAALPARAAELVLDGHQGAEEWAGAAEYPLAGGGTALVRYRPDEIHVGFRGTEQGWTHVYLSDGERALVLHASAALGTAEYRREGEIWQIVRQFEWGMRDPSMEEEAVAARESHFETQGWVASTMHMGDESFIEFRIDRELIGTDAGRIALVFAASADTPRYWPETLTDDTLAEQLIFGNSPTPLRFEPSSWSRLD